MDRSSPSRDNEISNVMEVTDRSGKVGFVAIGRRPPPPPSTPPAAVIHRTSNQQISTMTTNLNNSTSNNDHITPHPTTTPHHVRNSSNQHHMRLSVSGRLNEGYEADHIPTSTTTASPHIDSLQHNNTPSGGGHPHITPSSGHPHITPSSGGHHHRTASRGNSPSQQQQLNRISSTTSVVETSSQQQINRTSVVESQQITTTNLIVCRICGQHHRSSENHEYNYVKEADEDLQCDICLQPFIKPFDTKCNHTFCELCLKNHIKLKKSCPVDRLELSLSSSDCWESSQVLMKLVNKLQVSCPNNSCQIIINRGDLQLHLQEKCPGTILRCDKSVFGCTYRGERKYMKDHLQICPYQHMKPKTMEELHPGYRRHIIEIYRKDIYENMGIFIVGGYDTSLKYIIIQAIIQDSIVNKDGRIQPGDIITQVNNEDMSHVDHVEARVILSQLTTKLIRFTIMRYDDELYQQLYQPHIYHVTLLKPPSTQLGIKITAREDEDGIFILEMLEGKVASLSGELKVGDRILMISGVDMTSSTPECAAIVITESEEKVNFVISRRQIVEQQQQQQNTTTIRHNNNTTTTRQHESRSNQINRNKSIVRRPAPPPPSSPTSTNRSPTSVRSPSTTTMNISPTTSMNTTSQPSYIFKEIRVLKRLQENLGIVVAGGVDADSGRNLPIFIRDILTNGIMDIDGRLKKGDILINVNNNSLVKLTHSQAVNLLKDVAHNCKEAVFIACQLEYPHKSADFSIWDENLSCHHRMTSSSTTSSSCPSWRMWLSLPVKFHTKREIHLKLSHHNHHGGGDVGIRVAKHDHLCIIKHVVRGSIASRHPANIECGDVILEINGCKTHKMSLTSIQRMMTSLPHQIYVIMQLPGSLH